MSFYTDNCRIRKLIDSIEWIIMIQKGFTNTL